MRTGTAVTDSALLVSSTDSAFVTTLNTGLGLGGGIFSQIVSNLAGSDDIFG